MSEPLLVERAGDIETWTLNRPETRNAISEMDMITAIEAAVAAVSADPSVKVVIVTGAGSAFCSGGNVKDMRDQKGMFGRPRDEIPDAYREGIQRLPRAFHTLDVPVIAAVNGPAVGAGCDLTLMCDIRIASTRATFAESFIKVGLIPGDGGAWFLPRAIGMSRASEMAFTGEPINAVKAEEWGLVTQVVDPDDLMTAAHDLAERIAANPGGVLRMTKRLIREGQTLDLDALLEMSADLQAVAHHTDEHREAVASMLGGR